MNFKPPTYKITLLLPSFIIIFTTLLINVTPTFAHSVVKPNQVAVGSFQDFTLGVPSERNTPIVSIKLILPEGLTSITPLVKPGWNIEVKTKDESIPTEIIWTGGTIPSRQKDIFVFSAKTPAQPTQLNWKVYQTYSDGSTFSWDLNPDGSESKHHNAHSDSSSTGTYSKTMVINELKDSSKTPETNTQSRNNSLDRQTPIIAGLALLLSILSLWFQLRKKAN